MIIIITINLRLAWLLSIVDVIIFTLGRNNYKISENFQRYLLFWIKSESKLAILERCHAHDACDNIPWNNEAYRLFRFPQNWIRIVRIWHVSNLGLLKKFRQGVPTPPLDSLVKSKYLGF